MDLPWIFSSGKRFHCLGRQLLNVCLGQSHCSICCRLERAKVSPATTFKLQTECLTFQVCHVLRWLLVHTIHCTAALSQVRSIWARVVLKENFGWFSNSCVSSAPTFCMPPLPLSGQVDQFSGVPRFVKKYHSFTLLPPAHFPKWHTSNTYKTENEIEANTEIGMCLSLTLLFSPLIPASGGQPISYELQTLTFIYWSG